MPSQQRGMVLVVTLLFLFVLALLVTNSLENSLLATKISATDFNRAVAWQTAEAGLRIAEAKIDGKAMKFLGEVRYKTQLINIDLCSKRRYRITSRGFYQGIRIALVSEYDVLKKPVAQDCLDEIVNDRVFWGEQ